MNELISRLMAIRDMARDLHYEVSGDAFYSKHVLAERIFEPIDDYLDTIKEACLLGQWPEGERPKKTSEYEYFSQKFCNTSNTNSSFRTLQSLIEATLTYIEEMNDLTRGEENIVGSVAEHLQRMNGLLNLQNVEK